jgi:hypothetical protein
MRRTLGHIPDRRFGHIAQNMFPVLDERKVLERNNRVWAGYSMRLLTNAYTGNCLRVRRSSDNVESDIGFDGQGWLDENALTSFIGANSGFVVTWYDQSGNGRNLTRSSATPTEQPRIVNAGTIDKFDGFPSIRFDGSNDSLRSTSVITAAPLMFNAVSVAINTVNAALNAYASFSNSAVTTSGYASGLFNPATSESVSISIIFSTSNAISNGSTSTGYNKQAVSGSTFESNSRFYSVHMGGVNQISSNTAPTGINTFAIGALIRPSSVYYQGAFTELIVHDYFDNDVYFDISNEQIETYL